MLTDKSKVFNSIDYMRKILVALIFPTLACNAQEKKIAYPPCVSIGFYSSDILNCPYDHDTELKYRKIKYRLSDGNKNLSSSNYVSALYFFKLALNDVKPCYSDPATIDDTGMYEVLARSAEERGDYKYAATSYGSILENRMSMYDEKMNKNKASCITAMKSGENHSNAIASAALEIKVSGKILSAIIKITNNNNSPGFHLQRKFHWIK
jgi:hypothetical protein